MRNFLKAYIEDLMILIGSLIAVVNTYFLNVYLANYLLALVFISIGVIIARWYKK